ncbi:SafA/ExsA family spore coat assembly protein, partial [Bacillus thuringiensis]
MKIHIVQKGDTLWKIAKKYGVDFDVLKQANTQLSNPDLIMPGMKIKVPSNGVPIKKNPGAGSVPPKEYVKEVQQKEFPVTPKTLGIEEEEEMTPQAGPITEQPAVQKVQKEMQVKAQKEVQKEQPIQKEVQKEQPIQKEKPVEKQPIIEKQPTVSKAEKQKESTKFSVNILPQPPQSPVKPAKGYKIADIIKKGNDLIAPQVNKMKGSNVVAPEVKKENISKIVAPEVKKENISKIV